MILDLLDRDRELGECILDRCFRSNLVSQLRFQRKWSGNSGSTNLSRRSLRCQLEPLRKRGRKLTIFGLPLRAAPIDVDIV